MDEQIFNRLQKLIGATFNIPTRSVTRRMTAQDVDGWDSLSHGGLIIAVEGTFGVTLPDETIFLLDDVGALYDQIVLCLQYPVT